MDTHSYIILSSCKGTSISMHMGEGKIVVSGKINDDQNLLIMLVVMVYI